MSIEERDVIDIISAEPDKSSVALIVADHLPWESPDHIFLLQEKINAYLDFVTNGELFRQRPDLAGTRITIQVIYAFQPDAAANIFLGKVENIVKGLGYAFEHGNPKTMIDAPAQLEKPIGKGRRPWWKIF